MDCARKATSRGDHDQIIKTYGLAGKVIKYDRLLANIPKKIQINKIS
jgi:hypothetical protein